MRWAQFNEFMKSAPSDLLNPYSINAGLGSKHQSGINLLPDDI